MALSTDIVQRPRSMDLTAIISCVGELRTHDLAGGRTNSIGCMKVPRYVIDCVCKMQMSY